MSMDQTKHTYIGTVIGHQAAFPAVPIPICHTLLLSILCLISYLYVAHLSSTLG